MARPSQFDSFPIGVRELFELRVRRDNARSTELMVWLESEGFTVTPNQVAHWIRQIKQVAAAANTAAESRLADLRLGQLTGEELPELDPLEYLKNLFMQALVEGAGEVPRALLDAIKGAAILEGAFIQRQKMALDRRSAQPEGNPVGKQITAEGIKWVRENVYGIFDEPVDDADRADCP
jgi:hypothetical protein